MLEDKEYTSAQLRGIGFDVDVYSNPIAEGTHKATLDCKVWGQGRAEKSLICCFTLDSGEKVLGFAWQNSDGVSYLGVRSIAIGSSVEVTFSLIPKSGRIVLSAIKGTSEKRIENNDPIVYDPLSKLWRANGLAYDLVEDGDTYDLLVHDLIHSIPDVNELVISPAHVLEAAFFKTIIKFTFEYDDSVVASSYAMYHETITAAHYFFKKLADKIEELGDSGMRACGFEEVDTLSVFSSSGDGETFASYSFRLKSNRGNISEIVIYRLDHNCWKCNAPMAIPTYINYESRLESLMYPWDKASLEKNMTFDQTMRHIAYDASIEHYPISVLGQNDELDKIVCEVFGEAARKAKLRLSRTNSMPGLPYMAAHCPKCGVVQGWNPSIYRNVNKCIARNIELPVIGAIDVDLKIGTGRGVDQTLEHVV